MACGGMNWLIDEHGSKLESPGPGRKENALMLRAGAALATPAPGSKSTAAVTGTASAPVRHIALRVIAATATPSILPTAFRANLPRPPGWAKTRPAARL